ncbi:hypothetical protein Tco_0604888 [Tanacetum coccineum]
MIYVDNSSFFREDSSLNMKHQADAFELYCRAKIQVYVLEVASLKYVDGTDVVKFILEKKFEMHIYGNLVEVVAPKDKQVDVVDNTEVIAQKSAK